MKGVAIIITHLGVGGAERVVVDEANELFRRGIPVTLITLRPKSDSYMQACILPEQDRILIRFDSPLNLGAWIALVRLLRTRRPDMVLTHLWYSNAIGRIAAQLARVRTVLSFEHNVYDTVKTSKQFFVDRMLQYLSTRVVAVSEPVRDSLIRHGIAPARIVVVENGIDLARYANARATDIRKEQNLGSGTIFLFAGRLIPQKAVDVLVEAFARLSSGYLLIAGEGKESSMLQQKTRDLGISDRVFLLGLRSDIPGLMKAADSFVLPSRYEGLPIVVLEAMGAGLPIILSDFSAARGMLRDGQDGIIVPREDVEALAEAMRRMEDPEVRKGFAEAAKRGSERFSIGQHVDSLLACAV